MDGKDFIGRGSALVVVMGLMELMGCAGSLSGGRAKVEAVPPLPAGFVALPSESTGFRSAWIQTPTGRWVINFDDAITKIETSPYVVTKLDSKWYPEEGGADAALCRGYQKGEVTMVRMEGSSKFKTEETRILFVNSKLKEIIKYSLPGEGMAPDELGEWVPYDKRVLRESF